MLLLIHKNANLTRRPATPGSSGLPQESKWISEIIWDWIPRYPCVIVCWDVDLQWAAEGRRKRSKGFRRVKSCRRWWANDWGAMHPISGCNKTDGNPFTFVQQAGTCKRDSPAQGNPHFMTWHPTVVAFEGNQRLQESAVVKFGMVLWLAHYDMDTGLKRVCFFPIWLSSLSNLPFYFLVLLFSRI